MRNPFRRRKQVDPIDDVMESVPAEVFIQPEQPNGHVVRVTGPPAYSPDAKRTGGRMVRTMPRSLRKMKEHAEASDD